MPDGATPEREAMRARLITERVAATWRRWPLGLALPILLLSCSDPFGPSRSVTPQLRTLDVTVAPLGGGYITVQALPWDATFDLGSDQRVPAELSVSSGDREELRLYREWCPGRERVASYGCFRFVVMMGGGASVTDLLPQVAAIGGRLQLTGISSNEGVVWIDRSFASVVLFSSDDLIRHAREARSWPGVHLTDLQWPPFCIEPGWCAPLQMNGLFLPVRLDTVAVVRGDGAVQAQPGDTIVVRYRQPSGGSLDARAVVP